MSSGEAAFRRIQAAARSAAAKNRTTAPTQEYLIRHALESFLHRLTQTAHHRDRAVDRNAVWDVSTGDPIGQAPRKVTIELLLGGPISLRGYAPQTTIAEKGVTILERGVTSTRWRDYLDIVELARQGIDPDALLLSARRGSPASPRYAGTRSSVTAK